MIRSFHRKLSRRVGALLHRRALDRDLAADIETHIELETRELMRTEGLEFTEARRRAAITFGDIDRYTEAERRARGVEWFFDLVHEGKHLVRDLRFALRTFARQPGATALIVFSLALGVAANVAVFTLVDAVFFRPLPYPDASRLVDLNERAPKWNMEFTGVSYLDYDTWRHSSRAFEGMALWEGESVNLTDGQTSIRVDGQSVTYNLASVLGITPVIGRSFLPEEDTPNGPNVVMIGYDMWRTRFGGAANIVGKSIRIDARPFTVVGVLPPDVALEQKSNFWIPLKLSVTSPERAYYSYEGVGRLKPGVTLAAARADLLAAHAAIWRDRDSARVVSPRIMPLRDRFVRECQTVRGGFGGAVALVLLIACANAAGAMLARSVARRRELSIRVALGASTTRVARQMFMEALTLTMVAGLLGILAGRVGLHLITLSVADLPPWIHISDQRTGAFGGFVVVGAALLVGLVPSSSLRGGSLTEGLLSGGVRLAGSMRERRMLSIIVMSEVALSAVLLAGSGLLIRAYVSLERIDPGFRADSAAAFTISLPDATYRTGFAQRRFYESLIERVQAIPGVESAGVVTCPPFTCHWGAVFQAEGGTPLRRDGTDPVTLVRVASGGYLSAMRIQLLRGRFYRDGEGGPAGPKPVVINDQLAQRLWPGVVDPTGKRLWFDGDTSSGRYLTIVGVVKDVRHYGLTTAMRPSIYLPLTLLGNTIGFGRFTLVARSGADPATLFPAFRAAVHQLDPDVPTYGMKTLRAAVRESTASQSAATLCLAVFAGVALVLAIGGVYSVLSYIVGRDRYAMAIRMAVGASPERIRAQVLAHGLRLVGAGLLVGMPVSLAAWHFVSSLLVDVPGADPLTYGCVVVILLVTGTVATWIPALRASGFDPKSLLTEGAS